MTELILNELLCFVQNNFGAVPLGNLACTIGGFYDEAEVLNAKDLLFGFADGLDPKVENLPRYKTRKGEGKKKSDSDDLLALYVFLDKNAINLPTFVAAKLNKLPTVKPEDADVYTLTSTVNSLRQQVHDVVDQLKAVQSVVSQPASVIKCDSGPEVPNRAGTAAMPVVSTGSPPMSMYQAAFPALNTSGESYAAFAGQLDGTQWQFLKRKTNANVVRGTAVDCKLSSSSTVAESSWHVFVSRLKPETEAKDVESFLKENNIKVIRVSKLATKEEWQKNSAAFHVSVDFGDRDKVFCADLWPANVQIRDWYFKVSSN